jgi:hypothetical protein
MGSSSILNERAVECTDARTATVAAAAQLPPKAKSDPLTASLRAFAANFLAEYRKDSVTSQAATLAVAAPAAPDAAVSSATGPVAKAIEPARSRQPESVLPLAGAPPLGNLPRRAAADPVPSTRKSDFAEDLFADVMALTDEERIALFT